MRACGTCKHRGGSERCVGCVEAMSGWEPDETLPKVRDGLDRLADDVSDNWVAAFSRPVDGLVEAVRNRLPVDRRDLLSWHVSCHRFGLNVLFWLSDDLRLPQSVDVALDANIDGAKLAEIVAGKLVAE